MDEFVKEENNGKAEFYLATMSSGAMDEGISFTIDGQSSPTSKKYRILLTGKEPPRTGDRILVMKISGTYIVLGKIGTPSYWWNFSPLATSASLADVISRVNGFGNMFADTGIAKNDA